MTRNTWMSSAGGAILWASVTFAADIGTGFTYSGNLEKANGTPVNETCAFRFGLWRDEQSVLPADQIGTALTFDGVGGNPPAVDVNRGTFIIALDFGPGAIDGAARWLAIEVKCPGDPGFVMLSPRAELTPAPHAVRAVGGVGPPNALEVDTATGSVGIGTTTPTAQLTVDGSGAGGVGGIDVLSPGDATGSLAITSPSGVPGVVASANNGHRRDVRFTDTGIALLTSATGSSPGSSNGVAITEAGNVGIGTSSPISQLSVYENGDHPDPTVFTQDTASAGINIITDYAHGNYTPGVFWSTANNNATNPKAGIYLSLDGVAGTTMHMGTSNSFATGITNDALTIAPSGNVGVGATAPAEKLHVIGNAIVTGTLDVTGPTGNDSAVLPNSSISAAENLDEPGIASNARGAVLTLTAGSITVLNRTITVPTAGFVVAYAQAIVDPGIIVGDAVPMLSITKTTAPEVSTVAAGFTLGTFQEATIFVHGVFAVSAGANSFEVGAHSGNNDCFCRDRRLTLMFFPTTYGTTDVEN